jgi:hypothetical protein
MSDTFNVKQFNADILALDSKITHINYLCSVRYNLKETTLKEAAIVSAENIANAIINMQPMVFKTEQEMQTAYANPEKKDYNTICNVESLKKKCEDNISNTNKCIDSLKSREVLLNNTKKETEIQALRDEIDHMNWYLQILTDVINNCTRFLEFFDN